MIYAGEFGQLPIEMNS